MYKGKTTYGIEKLEIAQISEGQMFNDVLEIIDELEEFVDTNETLNERIFRVEMLNEILLNEENDIEEITKLRIEELFEQVKDFAYFMLTKI